MSIKAMTWYWDHSTQEGHKLLLLLALADWANDEGECYPSVAGLAKRARRDRRNIQRAIANLEKDGEILVYEGMGKGPEGRRSPLYYLLKYRKSLSLDLPPMIIEAAKYYRDQSRKQGKKGAEIRKSQAALLGNAVGVTSASPPTGGADAAPTGGADAAPTGGADAAPTGGADAAQIRQYDPSIDPSDAREGDHSIIGDIGDQPKLPPPRPSATQSKRLTRVTSPHYDPRKVVNGYIPTGQGATAVEVYFERYSPTDHRLTAPQQDDLAKVVTDLTRWREVVTAWNQSGYKASNIKGMLEWYGDPSRYQATHTHTNGHSKPSPVNADIKLKDWLLRFYNGNHLPTVVALTGKTEKELRDEYRAWRIANGLPPG